MAGNEIPQVKVQRSRHCDGEYVGEMMLREEGKLGKKAIRSSTSAMETVRKGGSSIKSRMNRILVLAHVAGPWFNVQR